MQLPHHSLTGDAVKIPVPEATPVISCSPLTFKYPGRGADLQLRVTLPFPNTPNGDTTPLPIVLLSVGQGRSHWISSLDGYAPLYDFFAAHGFVVVQPTPLSSRFLGLGDSSKGNWDLFEDRVQDIIRCLDHLDDIEEILAPILRGRRLDKSRMGIIGHSLGGRVAQTLLGTENKDPEDEDAQPWKIDEPRIKAGVVLAGTGEGGSSLTENGRDRLSHYGPDFSKMNKPALIVCGDQDASPWFTDRGPSWHADSYTHAPGPKDLLWIKGANHCLGGIGAYDAAETARLEEESPERVGVVLRMSWAYLYSQLYGDEEAWTGAVKALGGLERLGSVQSK